MGTVIGQAEGVTPRHWPRLSSHRLYLVIGGLAAVNLVLLWATRAALDVPRMDDVVRAVLVTGLLLWGVRRFGGRLPDRIGDRLHMALDGLLLLNLAWFNLRLLNHQLMTFGLPWADDLLHGWDRLLGLDWLAYFEWVHDRPGLIALLDLSYFSLTPLSVFAMLTLAALGKHAEARVLVRAFFWTALVCILAGTLFPARAALMHLVEDPSVYDNFARTPGVYHIRHLDRLRDAAQTAVMLDPNRLPGLVTFPSFHTAAGVLLIGVFRATVLAVPATLYAVVMIAATPVFGSHYFVDLIAGTVVAVLVLALVERRVRRA